MSPAKWMCSFIWRLKADTVAVNWIRVRSLVFWAAPFLGRLSVTLFSGSPPYRGGGVLADENELPNRSIQAGRISLSDTVSDAHVLFALELVKISVRYTVRYTPVFMISGRN